MSFTSEVKKQICKESVDIRQSKGQLCALFQMRATLHMNREGMYLSYQTENAAIAKHIFQLIKNVYEADLRLSVIKKMRLKKNNMYAIDIYDKADFILSDLGIVTKSGIHYKPQKRMIASEKMGRAYLQGCFLASGSINDPKTSNYHLEMSTSEPELAVAVQELMVRFFLPAKVVHRKNNCVIYLKAGDKIADFLRLCNASQALFEFEDSRIQRDIFNQITRLDNCELANEIKTQKAAENQLHYISLLEANASRLDIPERILRVMAMRKKFPDANLNELCDEIYREYGETISKSGIKHRFNKIKTMASSLGEEKQ